MIAKAVAVVVVATAGLMAGCASSSYSYREPGSYEVSTSREVSVEFEQYWDTYVEALSQSFFVINNISKESRIINVSFSANRPSDYIDCGESTRTWEGGAGGAGRTVYQSADGSRYMVAMPGTVVYHTVQRNTSLEGRFNVYMAPQDSGTLLRVTSRYIWSVAWNAVDPYHRPAGSGQDTVAFSSAETGTIGYGEERLACRSNGTLESDLLNLASAG